MRRQYTGRTGVRTGLSRPVPARRFAGQESADGLIEERAIGRVATRAGPVPPERWDRHQGDFRDELRFELRIAHRKVEVARRWHVEHRHIDRAQRPLDVTVEAWCGANIMPLPRGGGPPPRCRESSSRGSAARGAVRVCCSATRNRRCRTVRSRRGRASRDPAHGPDRSSTTARRRATESIRPSRTPMCCAGPHSRSCQMRFVLCRELTRVLWCCLSAQRAV